MYSSNSILFIFTSFFIFLLPTSITSANGGFSEDALQATMERTTRLHFYFQDVVSGKNATAVPITGKGFGFGSTFVVDDALTEGPEINSGIVGRAQGTYARAAQKDIALLMAMTFVFTQRKYNGSSISMLGRNHVFDDVREMPIVGGSGVFRFARGYALAQTVWYDPKTGNACVEYNVTVKHLGC